jgi:hypothetical protein
VCGEWRSGRGRCWRGSGRQQAVYYQYTTGGLGDWVAEQHGAARGGRWLSTAGVDCWGAGVAKGNGHSASGSLAWRSPGSPAAPWMGASRAARTASSRLTGLNSASPPLLPSPRWTCTTPPPREPPSATAAMCPQHDAPTIDAAALDSTAQLPRELQEEPRLDAGNKHLDHCAWPPAEC